MRFVGRKKQLEKLDNLLYKRSASLVVIRGRRRIGKSRLVEEFAKEMPLLSFTGLPPTEQTSAQQQREEFARQLEIELGITGIKADDWGTLFTFLAKNTKTGRYIIFLDEISWMGSRDSTFLGKLKIVWDILFSKNPELILILCGSVSSWIEKNIISSTGFFGRISQKILLEELSLPECNQLLTEVGFRGSDYEKLMILAITGGIPWYLELIKPNLSAAENIRQLCFEKEGILVDEFKQIFHDLFGRRSDLYQRIIYQLADGPAEYKEIAEKLDYPSGGPLSDYLNDLVLSGYVSRDHTWSLKTGKERKIFRYRLSDNYLRFYFNSIEPNYQKIQRNTDGLVDLPGFQTIMELENILLNNRHLALEKLHINPADIVYDNPYYQRKTATQRGCQVDYLIQTRFRTLYVCELKFSKNEIRSTIVQDMQEKIDRLVVPRGFSCLPVLIHAGYVSQAVEESSYFTEIVDLCSLLQ